MVFLPEAFDYISSSKEEGLSLAQTLDGPLIGQYCQLARQRKLWLSLGGFHEKVRSMKRYVAYEENEEKKLTRLIAMGLFGGGDKTACNSSTYGGVKPSRSYISV